MLIKPVLSEYHIIGWSAGNYGSARRKALSKRNEADRRRRDQLKALEQNAKFFDIISGAGAPPKFSGSDMGLSGRYAMGGSAAGKTGWGFDEVTVGYSSDFRPQPIKQKKIWFQYQEGFRHGGGKYVGQWGTRDARIGYEGADDWQRKINAAYWGRQSREAEVQKVKDIQASIVPWDVYEKQQQSRWSGRKYGLSADTQSTLSSEATRAGGVGQGSGKKESYATQGEKDAEAARKAAEEKADSMSGDKWLRDWNERMGTNTTWEDVSRMGTVGWSREMKIDRLLASDDVSAREKDVLKKKLEAGVSDIEGDYTSLNKIFSKHSSKFGGPPGTSTPSSTTYIGKNRDGKKSAANDTKMNFLYDTIISKMPNIDIDVSHQDRDVVLASFIDKEKELTDREYELKQQLTTGEYLTPDKLEVEGNVDVKTTIDWGEGKTATVDMELSPEAQKIYGELDASRNPMAKVSKGGLDIGILKTQLETVQDKKKLLAAQKSAFMTNEEALLEAERINTESTARKKAMKELKDYKPFEDMYGGAEYLNYLNPEDVSGFYERSQELPRLTATSVSSTYYNILGGSDYDPYFFEKYSTSYDPETDIYLKVDGKYKQMPRDEFGALDLSGADSKTIEAIRKGEVGFIGYSKTQQRGYELGINPDEYNRLKIAEGSNFRTVIKENDKVLSVNPSKKTSLKEGQTIENQVTRDGGKTWELFQPAVGGEYASKSSINIRSALQSQIKDEADYAFLMKQYQVGQAEADYTQINQLAERDNFMDSQGRLRDGERYGQAMGRLYHRTKDEVPTIKIGIESLQTEVDALRVEKKALDTTYRDYRSKIRDKQEQVRETYRTEGRVDFDQGFADEIGDFAKKRQAAKLALNVKEQKLDKLKKNLSATEEELELLRKQKQDWQPTTEGGGGKIVNPARFAKYQMLAGYSTTSAMSPGERSARAQVRQRQVRSGRTGKVKGRGSKIMKLYRRSDSEGWDDTFSSFSKLAGLKKERQQLFRVSGV